MYFALSQRRSSRPICPCVPRRLIVWNKIGEFSEALKFPGRTNALPWVCSSAGLKVNTYCWYFHRITTKNPYYFPNIFVKSFSWVGSLLRDHTRWAETQLQGSKMDSLDSLAQITLLFQQTCQSHENFAIFQRRREVGLSKFKRGLFESTISKLVSEG